MANEGQDGKPELTEKLRQEAMSEDEMDELRESGQGFEREAEGTPDHANGTNAPSLLDPEAG